MAQKHILIPGLKLLQELKCTICWKIMNMPKTLACQHSFCSGCLARTRPEICPLCTEEYYQEPGINRSLENIIKMFKDGVTQIKKAKIEEEKKKRQLEELELDDSDDEDYVPSPKQHRR